MKKILISLSIIGIVAAIATGATISYFSDTETSAGNTFTAGELNLKIDNSSYYNGVSNQGTSWLLSDSLEGKFFFDFQDLKPGDWGEDTISLRTGNDAWACMGIDLTSWDDNELTEPEEDDGDTTGGTNEGELQNEVYFIWWADDGDNVLETDEENSVFFQENLISALDGLIVTLADSSGNGIFQSIDSESLDGNTTYYIGKAWCFGDFTLTPVAPGDGGPDVRDDGVTCDGSGVNNITQTDSVTADIFFSAVQSRHNPNFLCESCSATGSQLILNDGFEGPPNVTHPAGWDIFDDGTGGLGWSVEWVNSTTPYQEVPRPAVAKIEFHKNGNEPNTSDIPDGWIAHSGYQYIELDSDWNGHIGTLNGEPALARIYQNITTVPGRKYELKYWHSYRPGVSENTMNVKADGALLRTVTADGTGQTATNWVQYVDQFTATDNSTRIEFEGAGIDDSLGIFVDDVTLHELSCEIQ